jgi:hypothetical protein
LVLSVVDRDWPFAENLAEQLRGATPEAWMLDGTRSELSGMLDTVRDTSDRQRLNELIERLGAAATAEEEEEEEDA